MIKPYGGIILAVTAAAVGVAVAAPVDADPADTKFLNDVQSIDNSGLSMLTRAAPDVVTKAGHSVCTMLEDGYGPQAVEGMLSDRLGMTSYPNRDYYAGLIAQYAVMNFCPSRPEFRGQI
jgi:hypothetical protein